MRAGVSANCNDFIGHKSQGRIDCGRKEPVEIQAGCHLRRNWGGRAETETNNG